MGGVRAIEVNELVVVMQTAQCATELCVADIIHANDYLELTN
jgi:hypothetical protein